MKPERVVEILAGVMEVEANTITPESTISPEHCNAFGWRAFHLKYGCFRIGLAEQPRTVEEICEWYASAEQWEG